MRRSDKNQCLVQPLHCKYLDSRCVSVFVPVVYVITPQIIQSPLLHWKMKGRRGIACPHQYIAMLVFSVWRKTQNGVFYRWMWASISRGLYVATGFGVFSSMQNEWFVEIYHSFYRFTFKSCVWRQTCLYLCWGIVSCLTVHQILVYIYKLRCRPVLR